MEKQGSAPEPGKHPHGITRRKFIAGVGGGLAGGVLLGEGIRAVYQNGHGVRPYTENDVERHIRSTRKIWSNAETIVNNGSGDCLDGRGDQCEIGTPGGDMGDLVLKIAAFERANNVTFAERDLEAIFDRYLEHHRGQFYMHSDEHAIHELAHRLGEEEEGMQKLITAPRGRQEALLNDLTRSEFIGCGHLARMLQFPGEYPGLRPEIVQTCMKKFFREKWGGNPRMQFAILLGDHLEGAVVNVKANREHLTLQTPVPLMQPRVGNSSVFLLHPQVDEVSEEIWLNNALQITGIRQFHAQRCRRVMRESRDAYLSRTANALAAHLPRYDAQYDPERLQFERVRRAA